MQDRRGPERLELSCGNYRLSLMSPDRVSEEWVQWIADPRIMLPLGVKPRTTNKRQLAHYVLQMHAQQRAVIGIFGGADQRHLGLIEVTFERRHLTANIEVLLDTRRYSFARVAGEVLPVLLAHLSIRFKIEKFIAQIPETYADALAYFGASDWSLEAELADELSAPSQGRRLSVKQYAWFGSPHPGRI